ncbi:MAG: dihydrofolate reductase family protein [Pseudomonadota bacterium]|nr:dihydrofolate reductase family protein [Pseudomonadota bacterium]
MRRVRFSVAVSLDGYIAGPGGEMDWLVWSDDAAALAKAHWQGFDTVLLGRKTYEVAVRPGKADGDPGGTAPSSSRAAGRSRLRPTRNWSPMTPSASSGR